MKRFVHSLDIPERYVFEPITELAIDTETLGLNTSRDRLCCVQLFINRSVIHLVHFPVADYSAPNLKKLLSKSCLKIFHFARFDLLAIHKYLGVLLENVVCTRTLSKVVRTYTEKHGLNTLCKELLKVEISKAEQSSDWGATLTDAQVSYASKDVLYLPEIFDILKSKAERENRYVIAESIFKCLPNLIFVESCGFSPVLLFEH